MDINNNETPRSIIKSINLSRWDQDKTFFMNVLFKEWANKEFKNASSDERNKLERLVKLSQEGKGLTDYEWSILPDIISKINEGVKFELYIEEQANRDREDELAIYIKKKNEDKALEENKIRESLYINNILESDFLNSDSLLRDNLLYTSQNELTVIKNNFLVNWFVKRGISVDSQQAQAIGALHKNILVRARAGSGKTSTIINRIFFLTNHCKIDPSSISVLTFNTAAAQQLIERYKIISGGASDSPHIMTFHKQALAQTHLDIEKDKENKIIGDIVNNFLKEFPDKLRVLIKSSFNEDWDNIIKLHSNSLELQRDLLEKYRDVSEKRGLKGEYLKSYGEKLIADFLFEHDINYFYEKNIYWDGINYHPDFTIYKNQDELKDNYEIDNEENETTTNSKIVIEYFGMQGCGDTRYDSLVKKKINYWKKEKNVELIDLYKKDIINKEAFLTNFKIKLESLGVKCRKLSEDEIISKIEKKIETNFQRAISNFCVKCSQKSISPNELNNLIIKHECITNNESIFLEYAQEIYRIYCETSEKMIAKSFIEIIRQATETMTSSTTFFTTEDEGCINKIKYLIIDEYQDFSELFYNFIKKFLYVNRNIELFCVGDDWQAINSFMGSELKFFEDFNLYIPEPNDSSYTINKNYRSAGSIVELGNYIMSSELIKHPEYKASPGSEELQGNVYLIDTYELPEVIKEKELDYTYHNNIKVAALLRVIYRCLDLERNVVILTRTNNIYGLFKKLHKPDDIIKELYTYLPSKFQDRKFLSISTIHKYKGLEKDCVILLDVDNHNFPLIHKNAIYNRVFGETISDIENQDRRLFYVACTRAKKELFIFTNQFSMSSFLTDIPTIQEINWDKFPPQLLKVKISGYGIENISGELESKKYYSFGSYHYKEFNIRNEKSLSKMIIETYNEIRSISNARYITIDYLDQYDNEIKSYRL